MERVRERERKKKKIDLDRVREIIDSRNCTEIRDVTRRRLRNRVLNIKAEIEVDIGSRG